MLTGYGDRRTAIVATLGAASRHRSGIAAMLQAGVDAVRLSMGNGSREQHVAMAGLVREAAAGTGRPVKLLGDLQARKNRLGVLPGGTATWSQGDVVVLCAVPGPVTPHRTWTTLAWDPDHLSREAVVLIDDGAVVLRVTDVERDQIRCVVVEGGAVSSGRGVIMPGVTSTQPGLRERDADDIRFARGIGVDMIALSYACSAEDCHEVRALAPDHPVIGKVEHPDAVAALPELAAAFDGLMVARGDLGLELPFEEVPLVQKRVIDECARHGRSALVATHLLHSMREHPMPTRAEVADIATAVLDGAGALVLAGETGYGRHPVRVVEVLRRVVDRMERHLDQQPADGARRAG